MLFSRSEKTAELCENYCILRTQVNLVGKEYERKSYEELLLPAEEGSISRVVGEHTLSFSAEAYNKKDNGDLCFCIDAGGLPTPSNIKPSYQFYKRPDGSVYY